MRKTLRGLLRDDTRVEEGVQETGCRCSGGPTRLPGAPKTWLARIARDSATSLWRSERRRQRREQLAVGNAVRDAAQEAPEASVARMEMRQRVVAPTASSATCRIDLHQRKGMYVRTLSPDPLDFTAAIGPNDSVAFARGGVLPPDTMFAVTRVR